MGLRWGFDPLLFQFPPRWASRRCQIFSHQETIYIAHEAITNCTWKSTGGRHSHRLYSHSCDRTQSAVNSQTTRIGAGNGQSGVKKTVNVHIPMWNGPYYSAVIRSEPVGWGYTCTQSLFPDLQARGLALQLKYRDSFAQENIWAVKGQWPKISVVNGQTARKEPVKQSFDPRSQLWL